MIYLCICKEKLPDSLTNFPVFLKYCASIAATAENA